MEETRTEESPLHADGKQEKTPVKRAVEMPIAYNGQTIMSAASQGNLPVVVLLWGMASAKKQSLMTPDAQGNNPMHYACLANTGEVMGFLHQQMKGMLTPEIRLVDSVNNAGETPLLRSMATGQMLVIKALLDEKSDPLVRDSNGNTVFINCAKNCQFWCLNYMYNHIRDNHGPNEVFELVSARDNNGMGALEWAAESGDLNALEFLIRQCGLNPFRPVESTGQTPLHIAISRHRIDVALFLLDMGADPHHKDTQGLSPLNLPAIRQDRELRWALQCHPAVSGRCCQSSPRTTSAQDIEASVSPPAVWREENGRKRSFAVRRTCETRVLYVALYAVVVFGIWLLATVIPFYGWIPLVAAGGGGYGYLSMQVGTLQARAMHAKGRLLLDQWQQVVGAPEKYVGFWVGNVAAFLFYFFCCMAYRYSSEDDDEGTFKGAARNSQGLAGLDCLTEDPALFWTALLSLAVTIVLWVVVVWIRTDPGMVDTRADDFDEVMKQSILSGGTAPSATTYCRTTLVKKPIRSKYCTSSGFVVARMDHHCVWLNNAVGYGNHRMFMLLLYSHLFTNVATLALFIRALHRDTSTAAASVVTGELISQRMLLLTALTVFLLIISCGILVLVVEQTHNIVTNMTTNEKVNRARYWWMKGPDGKPLNRFDRGPVTNILEFLGVPGYHIDYMTIMSIPSSPATGGSSKVSKAKPNSTQSEMTTKLSTADASAKCSCKHDHDNDL
mmetsp:Transcript_8952/g.13456  ORF Transcript_8952/g.13456 Transcript_8952/m.13456 type:complete len:728 (-) Transcript_8952:148-2331(-)